MTQVPEDHFSDHLSSRFHTFSSLECFFSPSFKDQCIAFLQDALIARLCLNLSVMIDEEPHFFVVHLQSSVLYIPSFYSLPRPFRRRGGACDLLGAKH